MRISDEELELFRDWQPGDSITIDANSVGMLIQEVIRARVALRAYNKLDDIHSNCTECEGLEPSELCARCWVHADFARLRMREIIEEIGDKPYPEDGETIPHPPLNVFDALFAGGTNDAAADEADAGDTRDEESLEDHQIQGLGAFRDVFDAGGEQ